jgi:hypothetical protein
LIHGKASLSQGASLLATIYELSREFSGLIFKGSSGFHAPFQEAERFLGLGQDAVHEILLTTFDQVQEIAENLNVELNKDRDLIEIMEKANKALSQISEKMSAFEGLMPRN